MTPSQVISQRKAQVEASLIGAIQLALEDAAEKGGVTLSPVAVAGQVMPELVALCWHYLSSHPGFNTCGQNAMGEEFISLPR